MERNQAQYGTLARHSSFTQVRYRRANCTATTPAGIAHLAMPAGRRRKTPTMNALEHQLDYPFNDTLPEAGHAMEVDARRVLAAHAAAVRAGSHQPVAAARRDRRRSKGWTVVSIAASRQTTITGRTGSRCSTSVPGRPAGAARDRHALPSGSHRPRALDLRGRRQEALGRARYG